MDTHFKQWIKIYNSFSKSDRSALLILSTLILLAILVYQVLSNTMPESEYSIEDYNRFYEMLGTQSENKTIGKKYFFRFNPNTITTEELDSIDLPVFIKQNLMNYRKAGGKFSSTLDVRKIYGMNDSIFSKIEQFIIIEEKASAKRKIKPDNTTEQVKITGSFDPNKANNSDLTAFGLSPFQARNIVEYRKKGGIFKKPSDLLKIYGIDSAFFASIEENIQIERVEEAIVHFEKPVKPAPLIIELNSADTASLQKLNGIGLVFAGRILKYREMLGGFYSTTQLLEIYNFSNETFRNIEPHLTVDTLKIKKIRLNFADFPELIKHPYLNKKQVDAVLKYREKKGPFKTVEQVIISGLVDNETFDKIRPYLTCR